MFWTGYWFYLDKNEFEIFDYDHLLENDLLKYKSCLKKRKNTTNTIEDCSEITSEFKKEEKINKYKIDENDEDLEVKKTVLTNLMNSNIGMGNKDFMSEFMQKRNGFFQNDNSDDEIVYE